MFNYVYSQYLVYVVVSIIALDLFIIIGNLDRGVH